LQYRRIKSESTEAKMAGVMRQSELQMPTSHTL
jgi:hypothetical protein